MILGENKDKIECSGLEMGILGSVRWLICGVVCVSKCDVEKKREKGGQGVEKEGFRFVKSGLSHSILPNMHKKRNLAPSRVPVWSPTTVLTAPNVA